MKILIVYYSQSGNTRKVANLLSEKLSTLGHHVKIRNALTAKIEEIEEVDLLLIGTPVHGYILFGQHPAQEVQDFLESRLPEDLSGKFLIVFATYLFWAGSVFKQIQKKITNNKGQEMALIAMRRTQKSSLVEKIVAYVQALPHD